MAPAEMSSNQELLTFGETGAWVKNGFARQTKHTLIYEAFDGNQLP
jgi:hypothetical protein